MSEKIISNDYHDYVFDNGKCIGAFDDMYRNSVEVPWYQDKVAQAWYYRVGINMMNDLAVRAGTQFNTLLDIGCGLGYVTQQFKECVHDVTGWDISSTAVEKAAGMFPDINFECCDIRNAAEKTNAYDVVCMIECLWYVLEDVDTVKINILRLLKDDGYVLIKQSFPDVRKQFVGKNVFPNPKALIDYWDEVQIINICEMHVVPNSYQPHVWILGRKK